jgi:hypothetical protein
VVEDYRRALALYEDFFQKRQMQRLRKLLHDRASLPIASYEGAILDAVRDNQAVVVAGDTGELLKFLCTIARSVSMFDHAAGWLCAILQKKGPMLCFTAAAARHSHSWFLPLEDVTLLLLHSQSAFALERISCMMRC